MSKNTVVIYHGSCDDGFGAAYSAWKFFGENAEYIPGEYGLTKEFPFDKIDIDGKDVIILDFSYDKKSMEEIQRRAKYVRLIDHHKSAYDSLGDMSCCEFDLSHSGAYLAWKSFHPKKPVPLMIEYIQDRDLWTKKFEDTEFFTMGIRMYPMNFETWSKFEDSDGEDFKKLIETGKILKANMNVQMDAIIEKGATPIKIGGVIGSIINCPSIFVSDVGSLLSSKTDSFAILWSESKDGRISCGFRSADNFNVLPVATLLGGGGHPQACATKFTSYANFKTAIANLENANIEDFGKLKKKNLKP